MKENMSTKQRWLAAIRMQPVDRLLFWPKLDAAYPQAQKSPFFDMDLDAIHNWIGSDKFRWVDDCTCEVRTCTSVETLVEDDWSQTIYRAPQGELRLLKQFDVISQSWHPVEFPVKNREDILLMAKVFEDVDLTLDLDALKNAKLQYDEIGSCAIAVSGLGQSPLMRWVEWLAGVENSHFLLMDYPLEAEELFNAMHALLVRKVKLFCEHNPADIFHLTENTSTTLISPDQFRRYCARHVGEYARLIKEAGRNMSIHMCGHLKALLPDLAKIPAQAFEAFTSPSLGNTTLLDGRNICPDKCLIGGTNAMLWMRSAEEIIAKIKEDLDMLPHHRGIVVTSAGVMPPQCAPETIRQVCEWVKQYPARM